MSDLDDFFAKKDKTKRNKKKGVSNDDLDKKFETKSTEKFNSKKFAANLEGFIQDEGEWNDFVDEENKDYSGLKIQALSMKDKEEEQREEEESTKKEQIGKPWKTSDEKEDKKEPEPAKENRDIESIFLSLSMRRGPRINDAVEFPDLGTGSEAYEELKGFQPVRTTGVNKPNSSGQDESISTDNKYNALRNNSN